MHIYAWKIPWTEEPGGLQSMGSGEGNGNPLQCSCLENLRASGAWWAAVSEVTQSRTRVKRLSSSSSMQLLPGLLKNTGSPPWEREENILSYFV